MKTFNNIRFGFTLVELIISASIALSLFGTAYGLLTRGFFAGEKNLKNLSAIQEMSLIIYSMRFDLKAFHEKAGDESTYLFFDASGKKLSFSVVKDIKPDGSKEYCRISYKLSEGGSLTKIAEWKEKGAMQNSVTRHAGNGSIKEFIVKLFDGSGTEIIDRKGPYQKPAFMELKIEHRASEKLDARVVLSSNYPDDSAALAGRFWMTGFKTDSAAVKVPKQAGIVGEGSASSTEKPLEISESSPDGAGKGEIITVVNLMGLSNEINSAPQKAGVGENAGKNAQGIKVIDVSTPDYLDNYTYVKNLYKSLLERDLDQSDNDFSITGVPYWVARLYEGGSREDIKNSILDSEEFFVLTCFKKHLKRAPTNLEKEIFTSRLRAGGNSSAPDGNGENSESAKRKSSFAYGKEDDSLNFSGSSEGIRYIRSSGEQDTSRGGPSREGNRSNFSGNNAGIRSVIEKEIAGMAAKASSRK